MKELLKVWLVLGKKKKQLSLKRQLLSKWSHFPLEHYLFKSRKKGGQMSMHRELLKLASSALLHWVYQKSFHKASSCACWKHDVQSRARRGATGKGRRRWKKKKKNTLESAMAEFLQILKLNLEGTLKLLTLSLKYTNTQSTTTKNLNVFSNLTEMKHQVFFI